MTATEPYRDPLVPLDRRVEDLVTRMTLDEKLAQIGSVWLTDLVRGDRFDAPSVARRLEHGIGHVTRIGASTGLRPVASARLMNEIQRVVVEQTRLGIPVMVHEESTAGYCGRDATVFPQAIGLASTWDEDLITEVAATIGRQLVAVGARHTLAPVLDVARDPLGSGGGDLRRGPLPGRPHRHGIRAGHAGRRAASRGDLHRQALSRIRHVGGREEPRPGPARPRELREVYAEPFAAAIRDAGLASVMNSYASVDGLPCAGSRAILTDLLRDELGFDGVVVADYFAVRLLVDYHHVAATLEEAGARALGAGLDLELPAHECYGEGLKPLIADGRLPVAVVDTAVRRVLRSKFQVGLFERPYVDADQAGVVFDTPSDRTLARLAARESLVLLQNHGAVLPLAASALGRVAVIGPAADDQRLLQGDYHYPAHAEITFASPRPAAGPGSAVTGERYLPADGGAFEAGPHFVPHVTPLEGIRAALPGVDVRHAHGCSINGDDRSGFDHAVDTAQQADVALVFVGGRSGLLPECTVGESRDASDLRLTGLQEELVVAVASTGTPTVVVILSGRVNTLHSRSPTPYQPSSRPGSPERRAALPSPRCCSVGASPEADSPFRCHGGWARSPCTTTCTPAVPARCSGVTTPMGRRPRCGRSGTGSPTPTSPTAPSAPRRERRVISSCCRSRSPTAVSDSGPRSYSSTCRDDVAAWRAPTSS